MTGPGRTSNVPVDGSVDLRAGQVGRKQVGRELDPPEGQVERTGQRTDGAGLRQARHALEQDVTRGQQGDDEALEQATLPDHVALQPLEQLVQQAAGGFGVGHRAACGPRGDETGGDRDGREMSGYDLCCFFRSIILRRISVAASLVSLNCGLAGPPASSGFFFLT